MRILHIDLTDVRRWFDSLPNQYHHFDCTVDKCIFGQYLRYTKQDENNYYAVYCTMADHYYFNHDTFVWNNERVRLEKSVSDIIYKYNDLLQKYPNKQELIDAGILDMLTA